MEWWVTLAIIIVSLLVLFASGIPVAFAFLLFNIVGFIVWMGGVKSLELLIPSIYTSIAVFTYLAVPLFIIMGELLYHTGLARILIDGLSKWVGKIHGSLALVAIAGGTLFAMMSGSSFAGTALFGSAMVPEMESRGYKKEMIYAPILAAGSLATLIPPSVFTIILAGLAQQSPGKLLIASVIPGFMLAAFYAAYILIRCRLQPHLAPSFAPPQVTWGDKFKALGLIAPLFIIIFLVMGVIFLGIATPSEAAAVAATGVFVLAATYGKLNWPAVKKSLMETTKVTGMTFMIIVSSTAFSQLLAFTGTARELGSLATSLQVSPLLIVVVMQLIMIFLGMFIDTVSMIMICIPIFFPIIHGLGLNPIWFGILMLVNMEMGGVTPPFGLLLFTLRGVAPGATMADIYRAGIPVFLLILVLLIILLFFPPLVTWLPQLIRG